MRRSKCIHSGLHFRMTGQTLLTRRHFQHPRMITSMGIVAQGAGDGAERRMHQHVLVECVHICVTRQADFLIAAAQETGTFGVVRFVARQAVALGSRRVFRRQGRTDNLIVTEATEFLSRCNQLGWTVLHILMAGAAIALGVGLMDVVLGCPLRRSMRIVTGRAESARYLWSRVGFRQVRR